MKDIGQDYVSVLSRSVKEKLAGLVMRIPKDTQGNVIPASTSTKYSTIETEIVTLLYKRIPPSIIAQLIGRTSESVSTRIDKLGLVTTLFRRMKSEVDMNYLQQAMILTLSRAKFTAKEIRTECFRTTSLPTIKAIINKENNRVR